jgi:predicted transposase/invertase (TIGR01784 family)
MELKNKPHDKILRYFLSDPQNAINVIRNALPEKLHNQLDIESISYEKDTFLPKHLSDFYSDLLTSVPVIGKEKFVKVYFLFEHKSTNELFSPFQALRYVVEIWDSFIQKNKGISKLPTVIPIVIAHPESGWTGQNIIDLVDLPSEDFKVYVPSFEYLHIDAVKDDLDDYDFNEPMKALLTIWKYSHSPYFIDYLRDVFQLIKQIRPETKLKDFLIAIMQYIYYIRKEEEYIDIEKIADEELGEDNMGTIAEMLERRGEERILKKKDQWEREAEKKGKTEAEIRTSQEMLIEYIQDELDIPSQKLIDKIRAINSYDLLRGLFRKARKVNSLDEFAKEVEKVFN